MMTKKEFVYIQTDNKDKQMAIESNNDNNNNNKFIVDVLDDGQQIP